MCEQRLRSCLFACLNVNAHDLKPTKTIRIMYRVLTVNGSRRSSLDSACQYEICFLFKVAFLPLSSPSVRIALIMSKGIHVSYVGVSSLLKLSLWLFALQCCCLTHSLSPRHSIKHVYHTILLTLFAVWSLGAPAKASLSSSSSSSESRRWRLPQVADAAQEYEALMKERAIKMEEEPVIEKKRECIPISVQDVAIIQCISSHALFISFMWMRYDFMMYTVQTRMDRRNVRFISNGRTQVNVLW